MKITGQTGDGMSVVSKLTQVNNKATTEDFRFFLSFFKNKVTFFCSKYVDNGM